MKNSIQQQLTTPTTSYGTLLLFTLLGRIPMDGALLARSRVLIDLDVRASNRQ